jgi:hypothetical protein
MHLRRAPGQPTQNLESGRPKTGRGGQPPATHRGPGRPSESEMPPAASMGQRPPPMYPVAGEPHGVWRVVFVICLEELLFFVSFNVRYYAWSWECVFRVHVHEILIQLGWRTPLPWLVWIKNENHPVHEFRWWVQVTQGKRYFHGCFLRRNHLAFCGHHNLS